MVKRVGLEYLAYWVWQYIRTICVCVCVSCSCNSRYSVLPWLSSLVQ